MQSRYSMHTQNLHTVFSIHNACHLNSMNSMVVCYSERNPSLYTCVQFTIHSNCYADNIICNYFFSNCSSTQQVGNAISSSTCITNLCKFSCRCWACIPYHSRTWTTQVKQYRSAHNHASLQHIDQWLQEANTHLLSTSGMIIMSYFYDV